MPNKSRMKRRSGVAAVISLVLLVTAVGTTSAAPQDLSWTRIAPSAMAGAIVRDLASNTGVLLAVGSAPPLEAGIWRSRDAVHWTRIDVGDIGENVVLQSVTAWRRGFAAIGLRYTFADTGLQRDAVVMTSSDGTRWRRADLPGGHGALPNVIGVHRGVLVAGGCLGVARFGCLFAPEARAVIWTSPDARTWMRRMLPDGEHSFVNAIASAGTDLVLVGSEVEVDESGFLSTPVATAIWEGPTAPRVRRIRNEILDSGVGNGVVVYRGAYLAVGGRFACVESWKRSGDGWTTLDDVTTLCDQQMTDATAFRGMVYATGFQFFYERLPVWRTRDARQWTEVTDSSMASNGLMLEGVAVLEWQGRLVIAGSAFSSDAPPDGQVWVGRPGS
jgi:hypothetical protein